MKFVSFIALLFVQLSLFSQFEFEGKTFMNKSKDIFIFHDNSTVYASFYDGILSVPWTGYASYQIEDKILNINFLESTFIDTSHFILEESFSSDSTIARICVIAPKDFFQLNSIELGILRNNFVLKEEIFSDTTTYFVLDNLDTLNLEDSIFINSLGYKQVDLPILFGTKSTYSVFLQPYKNIIRSGNLRYRISTKDDKTFLKLISSNYINKKFLKRLIGKSRFREE